MYAELLRGSALLLCTVSALLIFIAVFAAISIRAYRTPRPLLDARARMPLDDDDLKYCGADNVALDLEVPRE
ncbi:MAG: cbb3-type cytochrome c oxidase subunit 3 [Proteobacteria bacterium]|nr:cbb3-type cytochrome c oxidase subunit 3 [Pseudomonadota bacterium]